MISIFDVVDELRPDASFHQSALLQDVQVSSTRSSLFHHVNSKVGPFLLSFIPLPPPHSASVPIVRVVQFFFTSLRRCNERLSVETYRHMYFNYDLNLRHFSFCIVPIPRRYLISCSLIWQMWQMMYHQMDTPVGPFESERMFVSLV